MSNSTEHTAFSYIVHESDGICGHAECLACDWIGPERDSAVRVAYDCAEHEQEFDDDED